MKAKERKGNNRKEVKEKTKRNKKKRWRKIIVMKKKLKKNTRGKIRSRKLPEKEKDEQKNLK